MSIENEKIFEATRKHRKYQQIVPYKNFLEEIHQNVAIKELLEVTGGRISILDTQIIMTKDGVSATDSYSEKLSFLEIGKMLFYRKISLQELEQNFWNEIQVFIDDAPDV